MAIGINICPVKLLIGSQLFSQDTYKELQEKWIDTFISDIQQSKYWNEYIIKNFSNNTEKDGK